jgi:DNA-binding transcriptional LysR family regulator
MSDIEYTDLRDVDLNLLVVFASLMQTRSVTRSAEHLRVGQPAVSYSLGKLRTLLNDPLFARTPSGMAPTPRALAMAQAVGEILSKIEVTLFDGAAFDPAREARVFRVGAIDYAQTIVGGPTLSALRLQAPRCKLILTATDCDAAARALERGEIDVAVGAFPEALRVTHQQVLYRERYACVFDANACKVRGALTRAHYLALPHVIMSTRGDAAGPLDDVLKALGQRRDVMVSTPNFLVIPYLLKGRRLVATLPAQLANACAEELGLSVRAPPFDAPDFDVIMAWHARTAKEPGAVWLREQIVIACATFGRGDLTGARS